VALHHWRWSGVSLSDILQNLGWNGDQSNSPIELPQLDEAAVSEPKKEESLYRPRPQTQPLLPKEEREPAMVAASSEKLPPVREQTMVIAKVDEAEVHHTWGAPRVHHTWGMPGLHHSWH
jgi:hypothetical protein